MPKLHLKLIGNTQVIDQQMKGDSSEVSKYDIGDITNRARNTVAPQTLYRSNTTGTNESPRKRTKAWAKAKLNLADTVVASQDPEEKDETKVSEQEDDIIEGIYFA